MSSSSNRETLINGEAHSMPKLKKELIDLKVQQEEEENREEEEEEVNMPDISLNIQSRLKRSRKRSRDECDGASSSLLQRAKESQANLNPELPSFIKLMSCCHINGNVMTIPKEFCKGNMPEHNQWMVLLRENGEEFKVIYLARLNTKSKNASFSAGWREFAHKCTLKQGDALIFQLVNPCTFKVYFVRRNDVANSDGAVDLSNLNVNSKESIIDTKSLNRSKTCKTVKRNLHSKIIHDNALREEDTCFSVAKDHPETSRKGSLLRSSSFVDYKSFTISVNGLSLDSEISENLRTKYYKLCLSRKSYLHERVLKISNPRLAVEMIVETLNIADAIQGCGLFTSQDEFAIWDKMLESFEFIGMSVDFLRSRLNHLLRLALQFQDTLDLKRYNEAKNQQSDIENDIMTLETMMKRLKETKNVLQEEDIMTFNTLLNQLKDAKNVFQSEIDTSNIHKYELILKEIAAAPW